MSTLLTKLRAAHRADTRERPASGPDVPAANGNAANGVRPPAARKAAGALTVVEHPLAQHALTTLRNKHTASGPFREHSHQLLQLLMLEAMRTLPVKKEAVETNSYIHEGSIMAKPVVIFSVTRQAIGLTHRLSELIPGVQIGSISLNSTAGEEKIEPRMHIFNPPVLGDTRVILIDPIVATGLSASLALHLLRRSGASDISLVSFLLSSQGLGRIQSAFPEVPVWTAAVDDDWDAKRGPLPGIVNFAERMYA